MTAIRQREALLKEVGDLRRGVIHRVEAPIDVRREMLERRREWAEQAVQAAREYAPETVAEAEEVGKKVVETMQRRIGPTRKSK